MIYNESFFVVEYIIYKCDGINGRRDEQLQSISAVILKFFIHLMPTCYSIFCMKQKSGQANLRNKAPRNPIGKFILFA